ncbi:unnamed protein product, partial [Ectocarpus sp. 8 AP-2014]
RSAFVKKLVEKHHLLQILAGCLLSTLSRACQRQPARGGAPGNRDGKMVLSASHSVLEHRRYNPIAADLKCVLNIEGVPQRFLGACFTEWIKVLLMVQKMAPQVRQQRLHVEREQREWMFAFNINISLTSLFECMLGWLREPFEDTSIPAGFFSSMTATATTTPATTAGAAATVASAATPSPVSSGEEGGAAGAAAAAAPAPLALFQLASPPPPPPAGAGGDVVSWWADIMEEEHVFAAAASSSASASEGEEKDGAEGEPWQPWAGSGANATMWEFLNEANNAVPAAAAAATATATGGTPPPPGGASDDSHRGAASLWSALATATVDGTRAAWEHEELPTFPGSVLRVRPPAAGRSFHIILHRFFAAMVREACNCEERGSDLRQLCGFVGGYPEVVVTDVADTALNVLSFAAEVRAGLWRKNGQCMNDQVLNYAEPSFCKIFRDLDLTTVQFAALSCGASQLVNHVLHRFQCFFFWILDECDATTTTRASAAGESAKGRAAAAAAAATSALERLGGRGGGAGAARKTGITSAPVPPTHIFSDFSASHGGGGGGGGFAGPPDKERQRRARRLRRRSTLDPDQQLALGEECLMLLILLVTEMPMVPDPLTPEPGVDSGDGSGTGVGGRGGGSPETAGKGTAGGGRMARQLRRELVHRLASAPCTHSELQDTCYASSHNETLEAEVMEAILREVATRREPSNALDSGRFVLKPEVFAAEYDSTFSHQSLQAHQQASERRPAIKGPTPVAPPPPAAHPLFKQLRVDLVKDETMLRVVGQVLLDCSRKTPGRSRDTLLLRGLHLLTLAVHVVDPSTASSGGPPGAGRDAAASAAAAAGVKSGDGGGGQGSDLEAFCSAIVQPMVQPPPLPPPVVPPPGAAAAAAAPGGRGGNSSSSGSSGDGDDEENADVPAPRTRTLWGELDSVYTHSPPPPPPSLWARHRGEAPPPLSVLQLLVELDAAPWDQSDKFLSSGVKWLLERLAGMSERCREIITPTPSPAACLSPGGIGGRSGGAVEKGAASVGGRSSNGGGGNATAVMEERRKAARKRAMDMIEQKASAFARQIDMMAASSSSSEDEEVKDGGGGGGLSSGAGAGRRPAGTCASPAGGSGSSAGGAAGRRGKQRLKRKQRERRSSISSKEQRPECIVCRDDADRGPLGFVGFGRRSQVLDVRPDGEERSLGVHLQFCGHALHYSCFEKYYVTMVQISDSNNNVALDVDKGEFHCPFCKAVGNLMVRAFVE